MGVRPALDLFLPLTKSAQKNDNKKILNKDIIITLWQSNQVQSI